MTLFSQPGDPAVCLLAEGFAQTLSWAERLWFEAFEDGPRAALARAMRGTLN